MIGYFCDEVFGFSCKRYACIFLGVGDYPAVPCIYYNDQALSI